MKPIFVTGRGISWTFGSESLSQRDTWIQVEEQLKQTKNCKST